MSASGYGGERADPVHESYIGQELGPLGVYLSIQGRRFLLYKICFGLPHGKFIVHSFDVLL